jgi:hypothetical protein
VLVRTDIPFANQLVQVGHACLEAGHRFPQPAEPCHLVLFGVADEDRLKRAVEAIRRQGLRVAVFYEEDYPAGHTAACTEPVPEGEQQRPFRRFRLWK